MASFFLGERPAAGGDRIDRGSVANPIPADKVDFARDQR